MTAADKAPSLLSSKRQRLCSRAHAERVAWRICDAEGGPVGVLRTGDRLQPYRVTASPLGDEADLEIAVLT